MDHPESVPKDALKFQITKNLIVYVWQHAGKVHYSVHFAPSVRVVLVSPETNQVLVLYETNTTRDRPYISLPGGEKKPMETVEDAARRELLEEIGVQCDNLSLWHIHARKGKIIKYTYFFIAVIPPSVNLQGLQNKYQSIVPKWISFDEFIDLGFHGSAMWIPGGGLFEKYDVKLEELAPTLVGAYRCQRYKRLLGGMLFGSQFSISSLKEVCPHGVGRDALHDESCAMSHI